MKASCKFQRSGCDWIVILNGTMIGFLKSEVTVYGCVIVSYVNMMQRWEGSDSTIHSILRKIKKIRLIKGLRYTSGNNITEYVETNYWVKCNYIQLS
jgi:hypothetical protein